MSESHRILMEGRAPKGVVSVVDSFLPRGDCVYQQSGCDRPLCVVSAAANRGEPFDSARHDYIQAIFEAVMAAPNNRRDREAAARGVIARLRPGDIVE